MALASRLGLFFLHIRKHKRADPTVQGEIFWSHSPICLQMTQGFFFFFFNVFVFGTIAEVSANVRITQNLYVKRMEELKTAIKADEQTYK